MLSAIADPILPVFFVMSLGLVLGKTGVFSKDMARTLNAFVFYIAQPSLIFLLAANAPFGEYDLPALGLYFLSELILYGGVALIAYRGFGCDPREAILLGMTGVFVNHLYYVLPIVQLLHGAEASAPIEGAVFVDVAVLFCGTIFVVDLVSRRSVPLKNYPAILVKNPALLALVFGIAANLAEPAVPSGLNTFAQFAGNSAPPISLFALGVVLSRVKIFQVNGLLSTVVLAKILIHPMLAFGLLSAAAAPANWSGPLIMLAAGPCGAMPFVIALQYKVETETMSRAILISTLVSVVSLAWLSGLLQ
jgi:predicted permease